MLTLKPAETEVYKAFSVFDNRMYSLYANRFTRDNDIGDETMFLEREYVEGHWTTAKVGLLYCYNKKQFESLKDVFECCVNSIGSCYRGRIVLYRCKAKHWLIPPSECFLLGGSKIDGIIEGWKNFMKDKYPYRSQSAKRWVYAREVMPIERLF